MQIAVFGNMMPDPVVKIIRLIHEPGLIELILRHLGLWEQQPDPHRGKNQNTCRWASRPP